MASTVFDSAIFRDSFGTQAMRDVFSDENYLQMCLDTEAALARAQASVGMIPAEAAKEITAKAKVSCLDLARLKVEYENVGYPIVSLATQLAEVCAKEAGGYVHWGATTQDIMNSVRIVQVCGYTAELLPKAAKQAMLIHIELESPLNPHTPAEREALEKARDSLLNTIKVYGR